MAKYNERLVNKIVRLIEEDIYTIGEICDGLRISRNTFYEWKNTKPEFRKAIEQAEDRRDDDLAALARKSLREKIEGCIIVTERVTYVDDGYGGQTMKSKVVTQRKCQPDTRAIKLALERQDKRREKEEGQNREQPEQKAMVLKFPAEADRVKTEEMMRSFLRQAKEKAGNRPKSTEDEDEELYDTVRISE